MNNTSVLFNILSFLVSLFTAFLPYFLSRKIPLDLVKERHEKLISPMFYLLEPVLYQKVNDAILYDCYLIWQSNKHLADSDLLIIFNEFKTGPSDKVFVELCSYIDTAYDKSCRKLKLKTRTLPYRLNHHQYKSTLHFWSYLLLFLLHILLQLFLIAVITLIFFGVLSSMLENASLLTQALVLLILFFISIALVALYEPQ